VDTVAAWHTGEDGEEDRENGGGDSREPAMELLVHGVGGATPQEMLTDPRTTRVTGDGTASIHRRTDDLADRPWDDADPTREAYTWSGLTSGNAARALWLLLLPFMVANLAHWMRPAAPAGRRTARAYEILVRLLALSLTVLLIAAACAVCLDLVAWQCAGSAACVADSSWLGPLQAGEGWWGQPGRRLALAALPPTALVGLLWWLSRRTWSAYESASPPPRPRADAGGRAALSLPGFWYGRGIVSRLRATHTTAALLTVCAALLAATGPYDRGADGDAALAALGWLLAALVAAGIVAVAAQQARHGRTEEEIDEQPVPRAVGALPLAALVLLALTVAHTAWSRPDWVTDGRHPAGGGTFPALTVAQGVLVVGVALAAHRLHRGAPHADRGALAGLGGAAVALLACALGGVLTGGVTQRVADWLDPSAEPGEPGATIAGPPVLLSWEAAAIPALLCVVLGLAVAAWLRVVRRTRRLAPAVRGRYADEPVTRLDERSEDIAAAQARAELTDAAPTAVGWITGASLVLGVAAVAGSLTDETPSKAADGGPVPVQFAADVSQQLGSWLLGIGMLLLVAMGRRAYSDAGTRRTIGILWDVGTFWPRAAHPFAPPCYAERAVPDLAWRMCTWIDVGGGRLVISGHSQGSVLAAAAVWQLDDAARARVALLTHGSPLTRLYAPWFPAFFGPSALASLHQDMPRWRNLWRATDPIGGPVGVTPVDCGPLADPLHYGRTPRCPLPEPVLGHADYAADPAYAAERAALHHRTAPGPAPLPAQRGAPPPPAAETAG
jgi:hypothetical protein